MTPSGNHTSSLKERLLRLFREKDYRRAYVESFLNTFIAAQIKANREKRGLSQSDLADLAGMKQSRISALENVNYSSWSIRTLRRLAAAFDLVLVVRFESFGAVLNDIADFKRETLERPSFEEDPAFVKSPLEPVSTIAASPSESAVVSFQGYRSAALRRQRAAVTASAQEKVIDAEMPSALPMVNHG